MVRKTVAIVLLLVLSLHSVALADPTTPDDKTFGGGPGVGSGYTKLPNGIWVPEGTAAPATEVATKVTVKTWYDTFKMWIDIGRWLLGAGAALWKGLQSYSRYQREERLKTELATYLIDRGWTVRELTN